MLQETGIATRAQEMHLAAALRDKGYIPFFSSRLAETGATSTSRGGGLLTAVSSKYVAEHEVLSFTEIVPRKAAALEIRTEIRTEIRLLPYDAEAAPVQHCLWAAVIAAQDEPSLAPWLGPAEQHAYVSMPAAAVDKVFEHLRAAHDALARVVGRRQPSPAGTDPAGGDPLESGKRLQAAVLRYDNVAACAPAAYQAHAARHGIRSEAALRLAEELRGASPGFRPTTQGQLQEELERQAAALEEDICQLRALLAADRKRAIKEFSRRHAPDIAQRWRAMQGAMEVEAPGLSGLWKVRVPNTQTLLTEAHDVMFAVRAIWRELYDKRPVDLPGFQAVLGRHVPRVPYGPWTQVQQFSMQDLRKSF